MAPRDDFSTKTKQILSDRVGGRCSYPGCGQVTTGPNLHDPAKKVNTGVAAHITAAAKGGPRFDESLTSEQRSSIENGIWMCEYHGRLIDADFSTYTVEQLKSWKSLAEANQSELQKLSQQNGMQTYSERDLRLLETITDIFNYNALQALINEPFRAKVSRSVLHPLDRLDSMNGNPAYSFNNYVLEQLRLDLVRKVQNFWRYFSQQSAGGLEYYDYIDIPQIRVRSPDQVDHFYKIIENTRLLALEINNAAMALLEIRSRL
ncbi:MULTISPECIES: hypothetical protein [Klebsiella]|uniref:hypothetical protein n=1 Tax=Klebsiella TaxID=570 RepID=UPI0024DE1D7E|nr:MULTISPECIES: hypothetical protein [unclassified Klebsiella]MCS6029404.1 hypothetical protein [Klebsiella quasipneumoniae subsp. quasipneumoniae]MDK1839853.1 hypothetical protein [Klebsiella sp. K5-204]